MKNGWQRVKKDNPCPICGKPDYCMIQEDGSASICARISEGSIKKVGTQGAGWLHKNVRDANPNKYHQKPVKKFKPEPIPNWHKLVKQCQNNLPDLTPLAKELGVSVQSVARSQIGYFRKCHTFPIRDGFGRFIGMRMRAKNGSKFSIPGSKNALYWPLGVMAKSKNILFLPEGGTDPMAMLDLGFDAIGRPNNRAGFTYLRDMLEGNDRKVVLVADKDEAKFRPDGTKYFPGIEGALELAKEIKKFTKHIRVIKPPHHKDMRKWYQDGATKEMVMLLVENARFL